MKYNGKSLSNSRTVAVSSCITQNSVGNNYTHLRKLMKV